ncbi:hypothetical protein BJL95_11480 [Methylomonas sp. LWB]|nr:hypothetical protein BJL95_11480 [Methylomonas sp. LWB]
MSLLIFGVVANLGLTGEPRMAAEWRIPDLDGGEHRLADWRGQVVIVHFWASWCGNCLAEWPALNAAHAAISERGGRMVGVALDDEADTVKAFLNKHPTAFPVWFGAGNGWLWSEQLGNTRRALPFTAVFDAGGRAVFSQVGALSWDELPAIVAPLLTRPGSVGTR